MPVRPAIGDKTMLTFEALPAFSDNYIWLLLAPERRALAVVDPGDAAPVLDWLHRHPDWQLHDVLVTHHHADHVGGVAALAEATGARVIGPAREAIPARTQAVDDGDRLHVLGHTLAVLAAPGHTLGHVLYLHQGPDDAWLLAGDTLFAAGCGRLFEGSAEQMHAVFQRLAGLPDATRVYCAHEYTLSNLRFAQAVEPDNPAVRERLAAVSALREGGGISLPSSIALERRTNPFLRVAEPSVRAAARARGLSEDARDSEVFAAIRAWKDQFR